MGLDELDYKYFRQRHLPERTRYMIFCAVSMNREFEQEFTGSDLV